MPELVLEDRGLEAYELTYARQRELVEQKRRDPSLPDTLILVEHPDVYTAGRKSPLSGDGVPRVAIERGGEDTYHNPGQLVAYPILRLAEGERDLHRYLRELEGTLLDLLAGYGISADRKAGATGVWIEGGRHKIASIGVAVSGWVTYHGCALNVSNDLGGFRAISPCGFSPTVMTSMERVLGDGCPSLQEVKAAFAARFAARFRRQIQPLVPLGVALPSEPRLG